MLLLYGIWHHVQVNYKSCICYLKLSVIYREIHGIRHLKIHCQILELNTQGWKWLSSFHHFICVGKESEQFKGVV